MSRPIAIDPDTCQDLEPEGQEYVCCVFDELPNVSMIRKVSLKADKTLNKIMVSSADTGTDLKSTVMNESLCHLQQEDSFCKRKWVYYNPQIYK